MTTEAHPSALCADWFARSPANLRSADYNPIPNSDAPRPQSLLAASRSIFLSRDQKPPWALRAHCFL